MQCFTCGSNKGPFQVLETARIRFIRKVYPKFKDDSYLCEKCFKQFERIYKLKSKGKSDKASTISIANSSIRSVSSKDTSSNASTNPSSHVTALQKSSSNNNTDENPSELALQFDSRSVSSSIDSMDKLVQNNTHFSSLRDSSRKTTKNPELNIARQGAEAAVQSVIRRREKNREESTLPDQTPTGAKRAEKRKADNDNDDSSELVLQFDSRSVESSIDSIDQIVRMDPNYIAIGDVPQLDPDVQGAATAKKRNVTIRKRPVTPSKANRLAVVDEDSDEEEDIALQLSPTNLAHVRPIVRRRKGPAEQQFDDIMDVYIARTSGG